MHAKGFSLNGLLLAVATFGLAGGVGGASLLRAHIAANEAATLADMATVVRANATYAKANRGCYATGLGSLGSPPPDLGHTPFLDPLLARNGVYRKDGYARSYATSPGPSACCQRGGVPCGDVGAVSYNYVANAELPGRNFSVDQNGQICESHAALWVVSPDGVDPGCGSGLTTPVPE